MRKIQIPRGKGLGGSTLINGMIYVRGQASDYDAWTNTGVCNWNFATLLPYFRKIENYCPYSAMRGSGGPMHIHQVSERFPLSSAFLKAAQQDGYTLNSDYNAGEQVGFGYYQMLQHNGGRWSVFDGYLASARQRRNLRVETQAQVLCLNLKEKHCIGVSYLKSGVIREVSARIEVILCAGSVQTPQLLKE